MESLKEHNADIDDDDDSTTDSSDRAENNYWEALQDLSDSIAEGDKNFSNLSDLFPDEDDEDITRDDVINDIFGHVSDMTQEGSTSEKLGEFITLNKDDTLSETETQTFPEELSVTKLADF